MNDALDKGNPGVFAVVGGDRWLVGLRRLYKARKLRI
jgi:hypothetical protein